MEVGRPRVEWIQAANDPLDPAFDQCGARFADPRRIAQPVAPKRRGPKSNRVTAITTDEPVVAKGEQTGFATFADGDVVDARARNRVSEPAASVGDGARQRIDGRQTGRIEVGGVRLVIPLELHLLGRPAEVAAVPQRHPLVEDIVPGQNFHIPRVWPIVYPDDMQRYRQARQGWIVVLGQRDKARRDGRRRGRGHDAAQIPAAGADKAIGRGIDKAGGTGAVIESQVNPQPAFKSVQRFAHLRTNLVSGQRDVPQTKLVHLPNHPLGQSEAAGVPDPGRRTRRDQNPVEVQQQIGSGANHRIVMPIRIEGLRDLVHDSGARRTVAEQDAVRCHLGSQQKSASGRQRIREERAIAVRAEFRPDAEGEVRVKIPKALHLHPGAARIVERQARIRLGWRDVGQCSGEGFWPVAKLLKHHPAGRIGDESHAQVLIRLSVFGEDIHPVRVARQPVKFINDSSPRRAAGRKLFDAVALPRIHHVRQDERVGPGAEGVINHAAEGEGTIYEIEGEALLQCGGKIRENLLPIPVLPGDPEIIQESGRLNRHRARADRVIESGQRQRRRGVEVIAPGRIEIVEDRLDPRHFEDVGQTIAGTQEGRSNLECRGILRPGHAVVDINGCTIRAATGIRARELAGGMPIQPGDARADARIVCSVAIEIVPKLRLQRVKEADKNIRRSA